MAHMAPGDSMTRHGLEMPSINAGAPIYGACGKSYLSPRVRHILPPTLPSWYAAAYLRELLRMACVVPVGPHGDVSWTVKGFWMAIFRSRAPSVNQKTPSAFPLMAKATGATAPRLPSMAGRPPVAASMALAMQRR